jgi:hypothetical protein
MRPDPDHSMASDDDIIIVADDDSTVRFQAASVVTPTALPGHDVRLEPQTERLLILGWSRTAGIIISEFDDYVLEGSVVDVMLADAPDWLQARIDELSGTLENTAVRVVDLDPLDGQQLASVDPLSYDVIIVLPQRPEDALDAERVDAETIIVLLHLRKLLREAGDADRSVDTQLITEVLDSSNQALISRAGVNDFIISNRMVSMMFAQISEEPGIQDVYDDLFQEDGSEIYIKPAHLYFPAEAFPLTCTFGDLMAHARKRDTEICLGIKIKADEDDMDANFGVQLIPAKDRVYTLNADDSLVVLAEDDH